MKLRGFAISTQRTYLMHLRHFANHFKLPFSEMNYDHVRDFLLHVIKVKKLSSEYINSSYSGTNIIIIKDLLGHEKLETTMHTWGQNLSFHPHIHCIVPGGGLLPSEKTFRHSKKKFFIPVKVLSRKFKTH
jgi:hypothetical protein